jgi:hypothetical protein
MYFTSLIFKIIVSNGAAAWPVTGRRNRDLDKQMGEIT